MRSLGSLVTFLVATSAAAAAEPVKGVPQAVYNRIFHFLRIAQSIYALDNCTLPRQPVFSKIYEATTDINGRIYHDDTTREIIVGFRGTASDANRQLNTNWTLAPLDSNPDCIGCSVHGGYYKGWLSAMEQVKNKVAAAAAAYPDYGIVVTGHSLGASTAAIAASHMVLWYPNVTVFTYGEPRSGNAQFAAWMDEHFDATKAETTRFFRTTHANDGITNVPGTDLGFVHQGFEFWLKGEPSCDAANTYQCGGEQLDCAEGQQGNTGLPHSNYCGVASYDCPATCRRSKN